MKITIASTGHVGLSKVPSLAQYYEVIAVDIAPTGAMFTTVGADN